MTMLEYDLIAEWYASRRHQSSVGVTEVESLIAAMPAGASVLDVGCGTGLPLTAVLLAAGCQVLGVDSSPRMLERFRMNCPDTPFICSPIQACDFGDQRFHAAIAVRRAR